MQYTGTSTLLLNINFDSSLNTINPLQNFKLSLKLSNSKIFGRLYILIKYFGTLKGICINPTHGSLYIIFLSLSHINVFSKKRSNKIPFGFSISINDCLTYSHPYL